MNDNDHASVHHVSPIDKFSSSRYFQEVLSSSRLPSEINEIQLLKDGSWSTHEPQAEAQNLDTPSKNVQKVELEDDVGKQYSNAFPSTYNINRL